MTGSNSTGVERIRALSAPSVPVPTRVAPRLDSLTGIRAVIFDVYGTLFTSSSGDIGTSGESASAPYFAAALAAAGFIRRVSPDTGKEARDLYFETIRKHHEQLKLKGIEVPEVDIREVWAETLQGLLESKALAGDSLTPRRIEILAIEAECRLNPVWPMPGLTRIIEILRSRGYLLGIVSNAQFYTPLLFPALAGEDLVSLGFAEDLMVWSYLIRRAKPSPILFAEILENLYGTYGIEARQSVYIGNDMLNDIYAAAESGMRTVLFAGDTRSLRLRANDPRCSGLSPDRTIAGLEQLEILL